MAGTLPPIVVELKAISGEFKAKMDEATAQVAEFDKEGSSHSSHWSRITKLASVAAGAAIVGFGALAVKAGMEYQESTASLAAHAGTSVKAAQAVGNAFLKSAFHTTFSAQEMMQAFAPVSGEFVNMTGHALNAAQAQRVMAAAMDLAEASGEPLASTTKVLADVMLPFHLRTQQAADAANVLWNASRLLGVPVADLGMQFQRLTPYIAGSGMSVQQLSGLMVELSHSLGSGRMATRQAGRAIQTLIDPSSSANKALAAMGVNLFDVNGKFIGMAPALDKLRSGLSKLPGSASALSAEEKLLAAQTQLATDKTLAQTPAVKAQEKALSGQVAVLKLQAGQFTKSSAMQAIFGRQANAMLAVIAGGAGTFNRYSAAVGKSDQVGRAAKDMAGTLQGQMKTLGAGLEDLAATVGIHLVPVLARLLGDGTKVIAWAVSSKPVLATLGVLIGTVLVAAADHWVRAQAKMVAESVRGMATMVKSVVAWVAENGAAIATYVAESLSAAATTLASWVASFAGMLAAALPAIASMLIAFAPFILTIGAIGIAAYLLYKHWHQVWGFIKRIALDAWNFIRPVFNTLVHAGLWLIRNEVEGLERVWHTIWNAVKALIGTVWNFIRPIFSAVVSVGIGPIKAAINELHTIWTTVWNAIQSVVQSVWSVIQPILGAISSAVSAVTGAISGIAKVAGSIGGAVGGLLHHIPFLAEGGVVTRPTLAMVGEAGPELVIPMAKLASIANPTHISSLPGGARFSTHPMVGASRGGVQVTYAPQLTLTGTQPQLVEQLQAMLEAHTQELTHAMVAMG